jgi:simple sugar transport system permease protein
MDASGSAIEGALAAIAIGAVLASVHAFFAVTLRSNQILSGLALTIAGAGLAALIGRSVVGVPAEHTFDELPVPLLSEIPELGEIFFEHHALVYVGYVAAPVVWFVITRTRLGLHLRAVGENPAAADTMGVSVTLYRYGAVAFGGAMAGLAGATLSLAESPGWSEGMTAGRGWIAVALVIFALWDPLRLLAAAFLFGTLDALVIRAQIIGLDVPATILGMIPYVGTIAVLIAVTAFGLRKRLGAPEALGVPYVRGDT